MRIGSPMARVFQLLMTRANSQLVPRRADKATLSQSLRGRVHRDECEIQSSFAIQVVCDSQPIARQSASAVRGSRTWHASARARSSNPHADDPRACGQGDRANVPVHRSDRNTRGQWSARAIRLERPCRTNRVRSTQSHGHARAYRLCVSIRLSRKSEAATVLSVAGLRPRRWLIAIGRVQP
ncbi:hypothetical protein ACVWW4_004171 [Bradyrhizobium sp. LB7.1]